MKEGNSTKTAKRRGVKRLTKYLRELSVVVIGIAITFTISDWISNRNENKDLERYLHAVKIELENNLEILVGEIKFYQKEKNFSLYLRKRAMGGESLEPDSLMYYSDQLTIVRADTYKTSAFEMLKSSGAMRLIKDETFYLSIMDCYTSLESALANRDLYVDKKVETVFDVIFSGQLDNGLSIDSFKSSNLYKFLLFHTGVEPSLSNCAEQIKKTLPLLK